jgi:hypothetical protein
MYADNPGTGSIHERLSRGRRRRPGSGLLKTVIALIGASAVGTALPSGAFANSYTGLLYGGQTWAEVSATSYGANSVINQESWSAPGGVQFAGFAYTGATFFADNTDATGGLSAGFKGSGGNAPTDLNFPWTTDCSVSEATPRTWINNGVQLTSTNRGPGSSSGGDCFTSGSTGGWNYNNSEVESSNTGVNPSTSYQTLTLSIWCARDANCADTDAAEYAVTNLSGDFNDSYDSPSGSASWDTGTNGSSWYQTNAGTLGVNYSASDPAGVCSLDVQLNGPTSVNSGLLGNQGPGVTNVGAEIGQEFEYGANPCWVGATNTGGWTLPANLTSGSYSAAVLASNPGNYQGQGFSSNGSPEVAGTSTVQIDDVTPSVTLVSPTGSASWTNASTATVDVSTGPSGLSSMSCSDNGTSVGATQKSVNGDNYTYSVPLSGGANHLACGADNGDANGTLYGASGTQVYQQDSTVPSIAFSDVGYIPGTWTGTSQTIQVTATGGASGINGLVCTVDGNALPDTYGDSETVGAAGTTQAAFVTVLANGAHDLQCTANNAGTPTLVGSGSYQVDVDAQVPVTSFETGAGYAAASAHATDPQTASGQNWLNGATSTITVGLTGTEPTVDSGVQSVTCTINGYTADAIVLTNVPGTGTVAQDTPFQASFTANKNNGWIDGQNVVSCQGSTLAGIAGADGQAPGTSSIEYVDVNDPSWPPTPGGHAQVPTAGQCGIASVIDNGGCAYSNGPSQTTWYSSAQTLQITADDTGAAAPITSITCSGAMMSASSWTAAADPQDVDSHNGLTVTATIEAPGGKLDCSASDSADPVDSYELGTYNVSIDPDAPIGHFEAQGANGAAKNILQLSITSPGGSGIKQVAVQAKDENTGTVYSGGDLTGNPADAGTAYATLDPATGTYNLTVDPGVFPGREDKVEFTATPVTNAGVTNVITTDQAGNTEVLTPIELGTNPNPGIVFSQVGDPTSIAVTARAGKWAAAGVTETEPPASLNGTPTSPIAPSAVATIARWTRSVCKTTKQPAKTHTQGKRNTSARKGNKKAPKRSCHTLTTKAPRSEALPAKYAQKLEITGTLTDTTTNTPIAGASVLIFTTNVATGAVHLADTTTTGPRGRFGYRLPAGPNRRIDVLYLGTDNTKGIGSALDTTTAGKLRAHTSRTVRIGQTMRITGRILGGSIDTKGALVQMWYRIAGNKGGWSPFKPGRSGTRGTFTIRFPIERGDAGLTYRVRIKVPTQAGWGFRGATSNVLRFHVV